MNVVFMGYVQTEDPTWLDEAYASPINPSDTGIMDRNLSNVELVLASLALMKERHGTVVLIMRVATVFSCVCYATKGLMH